MMSQKGADIAASGDDRTSEARRMASALDLEQMELLPETAQRNAGRMQRFVAAGALFDAALTEFEGDANVDDVPFVVTLQPLHEAFDRRGRAAVTAILRHDMRTARAIVTKDAWPTLESIRGALDAVASASFRAN